MDKADTRNIQSNQRKPKGQLRMDKAETQETYSQTRENRRGNQGWTIQRHKKHIVKPEKTEGTIKDGQ